MLLLGFVSRSFFPAPTLLAVLSLSYPVTLVPTSMVNIVDFVLKSPDCALWQSGDLEYWSLLCEGSLLSAQGLG